MTSKENIIMHLGTPTEGDPHFYRRWESVGRVYKGWGPASVEANILITDQFKVIDDSFLKWCPNIKVIISPNTAHTHLTFTKNIPILSLRGETEFLKSVSGVAEYTMHLVYKICKEGRPSLKIRGKTIGILGMGRIGSLVAKYSEAVGMKVLPFDKKHNKYYLQKLFRESDFLSIHLNECPENNGFISKDLINMIKPTAYLINTSRPSLVDERSVVAALKRGEMAGYIVDAVKNDSQHWPHNFTFTGHMAGRSLEDRIATDEFMLNKLRLFLGLTPKSPCRP